MPMGRGSIGRLATIAIAVALLLLPRGGGAASAAFRVLPGAAWSVWQAEHGTQDGAWQISSPSGSGARYAQPQGEGAVLEFPFSVARAETLRVKPVWWPTGEQKLSHRFPYPMVRQPGPDAVDYVGATVFATAPTAGRVIAVDANTEAVLGATDVGGYLSDLVADRESGRVYVTDALGDRVVALDAKTRRVLGSINVPGGPWALALDKGRLFVACREGKNLLAFDTPNGKLLKEVALQASPIDLEVTSGPAPRLLVRYQQQAFDVFALARASAEKLPFPPPIPLSGGSSTVGGKQLDPSCGRSGCGCIYTEVAGPHTLTRVTVSDKSRRTVDVSQVTKGPSDPEIVERFGENPGPASPAHVTVGSDPPQYFVGFTSPSRGLVGIMEADLGTFTTVKIGGYLSDLKEVGGKLVAIDAAGKRAVMIDAKAARIESEIALPGDPWLVMTVPEVMWQRTDFMPPVPTNRLYVICRGGKELLAIDPAAGRIASRVPLEGEVRNVSYLPPPHRNWWDVIADDRIPLVMTPRLAVEARPSALDLATLELSAAPLDTPVEGSSHAKASVPVGASPPKSFTAENTLALRVDEKRSLDLSALADPQLQPDRALTGKDTPGSITVSLDDGPEYDWAAGCWIAPDSLAFLLNDSEAFWRYNAPVFQVGPGQHTLRVTAHSPFVRLDAVAVRETPPLEATLVPEPREVHGAVPLIAYQGVFYDQEPIRFTLWLANRSEGPLEVRARYALTNYLGETTEAAPPASYSFGPRGGRAIPLLLQPKDMGRATLTVILDTPEGQLIKEMRFLRLPKLQHPRLFLRRDDLPSIQARVARYPNLFRRYVDWLQRMSLKDGQFPERFFPPDMTEASCLEATPKRPDDDRWTRMRYANRNYEVAWRVLAAQLTLLFLKPDSEVLKQRMAALRGAKESDYYVQFHHATPFFPGLDASLLDFSADPKQEAPKLYEQMTKQIGDTNPLPWTLTLLEEPITPEKRALLYRIMNLEDDAERYFTAHAGSRGGPWWQNPFSGCHCRVHGYALMFMFLHNMFGEPRLFQKPVFGGLFTFQRYAEPLRDARGLQPFRRGPNGEPWHWILACLTKHPLEKSSYEWDEWLRKMDGPLAGDERAAVDKLMDLEGITLSGPMDQEPNYFVTGVAIPMALALGWYDPKSPTVGWNEVPATALFDVEGWVAMRSGFDAEATEVSFVSGVRDHTYRTKPNHFTVIKGGQYLIGTPALYNDDGNNIGVWANAVVVDDAWRNEWAVNLQQVRDGEHMIINRFSPAAFTYLDRDELRFGYKAAEGGWGGGLDLHGHTETMFMQEGRLLAYQTWPGLDFVAGDACNAWPVDKVSQIDRQLVFLKPDLVVVYDRIALGPSGDATKWIAATGPGVTAQGDTFEINAGSEYLTGRALLPRDAVLTTPPPYSPGWLWKDQKLLEIAPRQQRSSVEYLVVMRVGGGDTPLPEMRLVGDDRHAGVKLTLRDQDIEVRLNRTGPVGGEATVTAGGQTARYPLNEAIVDSYRNWASDPRYQAWTQEARFGFVVPRGDRR